MADQAWVVEDRFWGKVDASGVCWEWTTGTDKDGYGKFSVGRKDYQAHRWAYENLVGPIPAGMTIDHRCKNVRCTNPDHMELVPQSENTRRAKPWEVSAANRLARTHCKRGHEYNERNTRITTKGARECRVCRRERRKNNG